MERMTRELRQGATVQTATATQLSIVTYVHSQTCGGSSASTAIPCRVTYTCTAGACTRTEAKPDGTSPGPAVTVVSGLQNSNVFTYSPNSRAPAYVGVSFAFAAGGQNAITLSAAPRPGTGLVMKPWRPIRGRNERPSGGGDARWSRWRSPRSSWSLGGIAVLGLVDGASRNNFRAEQSQVVNDRLQQEMEKIKQLPYDQLALTSMPTHSERRQQPQLPGRRAPPSTSTRAAQPTTRTWSSTAAPHEGAGTVSGGTVDPGPTPFQSGDVKGQVYRYVTWEQDPSCGNCARRLAKAPRRRRDAGPDGVRRDTAPIRSSRGTSPTRTPASITARVRGPAAATPTPWTFWLTDTPCNFNDAASRSPAIT